MTDQFHNSENKSGLYKPYLSLSEAAELLQLSHSTLYKYVEKNKIPYARVANRIRFIRKDLEQWINKQRFIPEEKE